MSRSGICGKKRRYALFYCTEIPLPGTLLDLNPFVDIYNLQPGEEICVPDCRGQGKVDFRPYVVKEGDTLGGILKNVSMSFEELAKVNRILYNLIVPAGTILLIPGKKEEK